MIHQARLLVSVYLLDEDREVLNKQRQNGNKWEANHLEQIAASKVNRLSVHRQTPKHGRRQLVSAEVRIVGRLRIRCGRRRLHRERFHLHHTVFPQQITTRSLALYQIVAVQFTA